MNPLLSGKSSHEEKKPVHSERGKQAVHHVKLHTAGRSPKWRGGDRRSEIETTEGDIESNCSGFWPFAQ